MTGLMKALDTAVGRIAIQLALILCLLALWELAVRTGTVSGFLFGSPSGITRNFWLRLADGSLFYDIWITVYESLLGFVIGTAAGSLLGLALWYSRFVARTVEPLIVAFNSVPKIAFTVAGRRFRTITRRDSATASSMSCVTSTTVFLNSAAASTSTLSR